MLAIVLGGGIVAGVLAFEFKSIPSAPVEVCNATSTSEHCQTVARVNQIMLEDCLKTDHERITLYRAAKPTPDCLKREAAYAAAQLGTGK
jgi:hypothetical protein